jgi:CheY-like chemotaxis protein
MHIWVEFIFCLVLFFLWLFLDRLRLRSTRLGVTGWGQLLWGVFLLFAGSIVDVAENLAYCRELLTLGNTDFSAALKVGLYVPGILLVLISPLNWLSALLDRRMKQEDEQEREDFLQSLLGQLKDKTTLPDLFSAAVPEIIGFLKAHKGAVFLISGEELVLSFSSGFSKEEIDPLSRLKIDDDALSWCAKNNEPRMVKSLSESEKTLAGSIRDERIGSLICTPLSTRGKVSGVLAIFSRADFKEDDLLLVSSLGKEMGGMVEYINCQTEIRITSQKIEAVDSQRELLLDLFNSISELKTEEMLNTLAKKGAQLIHSDSCRIIQIDPQGKNAEIIASSDAASVGKKMAITEAPEIKEVVEKGEIVFKTFEVTEAGTNSLLALPLSIRSEIQGGLIFEFKEYSPVSSQVEIDSARSLASFASLVLLEQGLSQQAQAREEEVKARSLRILAIDDQETMRDLLSQMAKSLDYDIEVAPDANAGMTIFEEDSFDLVITELDLPGATGWDVCRKVRKSKPEVLVTLIAETFPKKRLIESYEIDFVLIKPFRLDQLIRIIQDAGTRRAKSSQQANTGKQT